MTTALDDRVAAYVADHPGRTAEEIALAVGRRRADVQQVLKSRLFEKTEGPRHSTVYRLTGRAGTAPTHKERVLSLLQDGRPHSHMEGYRLGVMLHSRVADLRRDGYDIRCWRDGDLYMYRLAALEEGSRDQTDPSSSGRGRADGNLPADAAAQLSLIEPVSRGAYDEAAA